MGQRLSEPMPVCDRRSWRLGRISFVRDYGRSGGWQLDVGAHYRVMEFSALQLQLFLAHFYDNRHLSLSIFGIWIRLPFRVTREERDVMSKWGFSAEFGDFGGLHLGWGARSRVIWWPWDWQHVDREHQALMADGSWVVYPRVQHGEPYVSAEEHLSRIGPRWTADYPYRYLRRSGEVQERIASVTVERRAWRRRFLPAWIPLLWKRHTTIDVKFSDEVGERSGTWKGGCIGCSYQMKPGERPIDTLRRMEEERRF